MIDSQKAFATFKNYVKKYDPKDKKVSIKISHIERVSQISKNIATDLKLSQEDIELAELIGLLHDIGRFEQIKQYHTFIDKESINHGELGVKILFEDGLIREFIENDKYDLIIKNAILNHNRAKIDDNLSQIEKLHSKIIRDADKLDILYILTFDDKKAIWEKADLSKDKISDEIYREFKEDKILQYRNIKTSADILVSNFAYVYDFNFKESLKKIKESGDIDKLYSRFCFEDELTNNRYNEIYKLAKEFVKDNS